MELKTQKTETKVYDEWNMGWWIRNVKHLIETISEDHIVFKQPQEYDFTNNNLHLYSEINSLLVQYGKKLTQACKLSLATVSIRICMKCLLILFCAGWFIRFLK